MKVDTIVGCRTNIRPRDIACFLRCFYDNSMIFLWILAFVIGDDNEFINEKWESLRGADVWKVSERRKTKEVWIPITVAIIYIPMFTLRVREKF